MLELAVKLIPSIGGSFQSFNLGASSASSATNTLEIYNEIASVSYQTIGGIPGSLID